MKQLAEQQEEANREADRSFRTVLTLGAALSFLPLVGLFLPAFDDPLIPLSGWIAISLGWAAWWFFPFLIYARHGRKLIRKASKNPQEAGMRVWDGAIGLALPYAAWYACLLACIIYDEVVMPGRGAGFSIILGIGLPLPPILGAFTIPFGRAITSALASSRRDVPPAENGPS